VPPRSKNWKPIDLLLYIYVRSAVCVCVCVCVCVYVCTRLVKDAGDHEQLINGLTGTLALQMVSEIQAARNY